MQTGKQFPHESLRRAIIQLDADKGVLDKELEGKPYYYNSSDPDYKSRTRRWELIYRRVKLMRKWWARVLGAKGNNSRVMPLWVNRITFVPYPDSYPKYTQMYWQKFPNRKYYLKHVLRQDKAFTLTGTRNWEPNVNETLNLLQEDFFPHHLVGDKFWLHKYVLNNEIFVGLSEDENAKGLPKEYHGWKVNYILPKQTAEYCILHIRGAKLKWLYECQTDPHTVDIFTPSLSNLVKKEETFNPWRKHMSSKKPHGTLTSWEQLDSTYVLVYEYVNGNYHLEKLALTPGDGHMPIHNAFKEWNEQ